MLGTYEYQSEPEFTLSQWRRLGLISADEERRLVNLGVGRNSEHTLSELRSRLRWGTTTRNSTCLSNNSCSQTSSATSAASDTITYCSASACYNRVSSSGIYCSSHVNICVAESCWERINSNSTYCSQHQTHYCSATSCYANIPRTESYCYSHRKRCQDCSTRISASDTHCYNHKKHYCRAEGCYSKINVSENYCSIHKSICQEAYCSTRVSVTAEYCSVHQKHYCQASRCYDRIPVYQSYCHSHENACKESYCGERIVRWQNYCSLHKKQTLQKWQEENKISEAERIRLQELNLKDEYNLKQLKEILEEDSYVNESPIISETVIISKSTESRTIIQNNLAKSLQRVRPKLSLALAAMAETPPNPSVEIILFSTWFNSECATIISKLNWTNLFDVWLSVRENQVRKMEGFVNIIWISEHFNRNEARDKAAIIRRKTNGDNPALYIAPSLQVFYNNNDYLFVNIIKSNFPITDKPDEYLLPLDIVERSSGSYRHAAIYLGQDPKDDKFKVCHIFTEGPNSSGYSAISSSTAGGTTISGSGASSGTLSSISASEKKKAKTRIDKWSTFLNDNPKELVRYRISIPFKRYEKEIEQIAKAVVSEYGKGDYHLIDRNCEHFAFAIACGVDFSEQEQSNRDRWYRKFLYRRGSKIEKFDLEREMKNNDQKFDNLVSGSVKDKTISNQEVAKKYEEIDQWSEDKSLYENLQEAKIEVRVIMPPKYHNWK